MAEVVGFLDDQGIAAAAFVGASFGGRVALEVATAHPDRVTALVLLCPGLRGVAPTAASEAFDEEEERLIEAGDVDGAVALNVDTWLGPDADDDARALLTRMQRRAFDVQIAADEWPDPPTMVHDEVDLGGITVPTTVVLGELDVDWLQTAARAGRRRRPRRDPGRAGLGRSPARARTAWRDRRPRPRRPGRPRPRDVAPPHTEPAGVWVAHDMRASRGAA